MEETFPPSVEPASPPPPEVMSTLSVVTASPPSSEGIHPIFTEETVMASPEVVTLQDNEDSAQDPPLTTPLCF